MISVHCEKTKEQGHKFINKLFGFFFKSDLSLEIISLYDATLVSFFYLPIHDSVLRSVPEHMESLGGRRSVTATSQLSGVPAFI